MSSKVCLIILDGWGHGPKDPKVNAILKANTPFVDSLYTKYPNSELLTCGEHVGLPDGQMGNSEVGHINIGAGRVVYQQLVLINKAFRENTVKQIETLKNAIDYAKTNNKKIHLIGLLSDGGVHSHIDHFKGMCTVLNDAKFNDVFIHAFTDGRDTDPKSGIQYIKDLEAHLANTTGRISTLIGRYFAMDRDKKWDRIALAYNAMVKGEGTVTDDLSTAIEKSYTNGITDEFIKPLINSNCQHDGLIEEGDVVINLNFRTDRGRQISQALSQQDFVEFGMKKLNIKYITMTEYDKTYSHVEVLFGSANMNNTLGEVLAKNNKTQVRIAETEKYPHVTFFFSGGRETEFDGESRIMCQSPKVATYDLAPEMSAQCLADKTCDVLDAHKDFIVLNFANADMVGHTGDFDAVVKAVETVDSCAKQVVEKALENDYSCFIIADHGNADFEVNEDGSPNTAHTLNPVPFFYLSKNGKYSQVKNGKLADLAPSILTEMNLEIPKEMTGEVLFT